MGAATLFIPAAPLELDAPTTTRVATAGLRTIFLLCLTGLAEATSASVGRFKPVYPLGVSTFMGSPFFFLGAFAHLLIGAFPAASIFLVF
jgi:hypothetical protein